MNDDAKVYKVMIQKEDQFDLQAIVNTAKNWSDDGLLRLNIDKCQTVSYYLKNPSVTEYHVVDNNKLHTLETISSTNDLKVVFDNNLTFNNKNNQIKLGLFQATYGP